MCWNASDNEPGVVRFTMTLIRHGQTINNLLQKIQGQKSDASLNWKGQVQALTIARHLNDQKFTHVYCSDTQRATKTCEIILKENERNGNLKTDGILHYYIDKRLRERYMGVLEGKPIADLKKLAKQSNHHQKLFTPDDGESPEEVARRIDSFFKFLCVEMCRESKFSEGSNCHKHALIVSHSGLLRSFLTLLGQKYGCNLPHDILDVSCKNTSRTVIEVKLTFLDDNREFLHDMSDEMFHDESADRVAKSFENHCRFQVEASCIMLFNFDHLRFV
ncbi:fructose-2,6-bisphosphatase TIGAR B-like isoform X1 [Clavelina lepadiformis]|uniref:fructose-2,6-bisphosphatase TIGAR B-like isoform X1 n=1 Tax=Clavelina lepadiformis TaxID=159417 RepID=UPI0040427BEE